MSEFPKDLGRTLALAYQRAQGVPGFMAGNELRFLAILAACSPGEGVIVEIGSFKGKSTVALATAAGTRGPVVAIDPHAGLSYLGPDMPQQAPTFEEFLRSLKSAGVEQNVEFHRACSRDVAKTWNRPIRLLWIDGDHSYRGCKEDFDLFSPWLTDGAIVAFHDTLNAFDGPIRVFLEEVLRSDHFGPSGFVHSIGWSQYRPNDGERFLSERSRLARKAARLIPYVASGVEPAGVRKKLYKLLRSRVPRKLISMAELLRKVSAGTAGKEPTKPVESFSQA